MNEHSFIRSIHNYLDPKVYKWKIHDTFTGGVPDAMYCGPAGLLFVEYKYIKQLPKRNTTAIRTSLSAQQLAWLDRISQPAIAALVIGCENSCLLLVNQYNRKLYKTDFLNKKLTRKEIAAWISSTVLGEDNDKQTTPSNSS